MNKRNVIIVIAGAAILGLLGLIIMSRRPVTRHDSPIRSETTAPLASKPVTLYNQAFKKLADGDETHASRLFEQFLKEYSDTAVAGKACFTLASIYEKRGELLKARALYKRILEEFAASDVMETAKERSEDLSIQIIFSPIKTEDSFLYEVKKGDTLGKLAKRYKTTVDLIAQTNGVKADVIRIGQKLKIMKTAFSVVIDKSQNILTLKGDGNVIKTYTVATGINNATPTGTFTVVTKVKDPTWYKQGAIVPPGSPKNILGSRWLGISEPGYGIHGSRDPSTIGTHATAGCVRMLNRDVEEIYTLLPMGTEVVIVD